MEKKAQVHMSETIAVIFIFFILVLFGLVFYFKYSEVSIESEREELFGQRAIDTTTKTLFLPELMCTRGSDISDDFCIDLMKLEAAKEIIPKNVADYYFEIFSFAKITIHQLYPEPEEWTIYDRVKPNATRIDPTFFTVSLKDEINGEEGQPKFSYGYVMVEIYS